MKPWQLFIVAVTLGTIGGTLAGLVVGCLTGVLTWP